MDVGLIGGSSVLGAAGDVAQIREASRRKRLVRMAVVLVLLLDYPIARWLGGHPVVWGLPSLPSEWTDQLPAFLLVSVLAAVILVPMLAMGRSTHTMFRPSEISVGLDDVVGLGMVRDEAIKTLNLFLAYKTFRDRMGGNPRRAILFEGPPGTGKTYMAKAMAREAGVPFLFIAASSIQSPYFGQTNRKIASFFKQLRKQARREGGAIGFIDEIDAIGATRGGMGKDAQTAADGPSEFSVHKAGLGESFAGVINELLTQLQSFDEPTRGEKFTGWWLGKVNRLLPARWEIPKRPPASSNILVIGATNRSSVLDPALMRPGRFDRSIHFALPGRAGRREIIDYYLDKKAHVPELDKEERRDQLAALTVGYSPVMIEHLFDEALVWSLRAGREAMEWPDIQSAKLTEEIGLANPVEYTEKERRTIATHEAGHAVVAHLVGIGRKLEVLSIIRRRDSLGLLAHSDTEERFLRTRTELLASIQISFGGMTAEELWFGESGTGPGSDLAQATTIAATMVGALGLGGSLISFQANAGGVLDAGLISRVLADDSARAEVNRLLDQCKETVRELLDTNRHLVEALRDELLARDELVGDEITGVLEEARLAATIGEVH